MRPASPRMISSHKCHNRQCDSAGSPFTAVADWPAVEQKSAQHCQPDWTVDPNACMMHDCSCTWLGRVSLEWVTDTSHVLTHCCCSCSTRLSHSHCCTTAYTNVLNGNNTISCTVPVFHGNDVIPFPGIWERKMTGIPRTRETGARESTA